VQRCILFEIYQNGKVLLPMKYIQICLILKSTKHTTGKNEYITHLFTGS